MKEYPLLIAGKEVVSEDHLNVLDPYNNDIVGKTYLAGKHELELAIKAAQAVQQELWALPTHVRASALEQISDELHDRRAELAKLLAAECAKPLKYALGEI
ncbi:MAG: aldehyde dehydrogenase family protein, partial [Bacteroidetes bacterium]